MLTQRECVHSRSWKHFTAQCGLRTLRNLCDFRETHAPVGPSKIGNSHPRANRWSVISYFFSRPVCVVSKWKLTRNEWSVVTAEVWVGIPATGLEVRAHCDLVVADPGGALQRPRSPLTSSGLVLLPTRFGGWTRYLRCQTLISILWWILLTKPTFTHSRMPWLSVLLLIRYDARHVPMAFSCIYAIPQQEFTQTCVMARRKLQFHTLPHHWFILGNPSGSVFWRIHNSQRVPNHAMIWQPNLVQ